MDIRQFERQYSALKTLSVARRMNSTETFLAFKKRRCSLIEDNPANWAEIILFLKDDLLADFARNFLCDAQNYSDAELEIMFKLFEHNQELLRNLNLLCDFLILAKILLERKDSGWSTQIESALNVQSVMKKIDTSAKFLQKPLADLMSVLCDESLKPYSVGYRLLLNWLPNFKKSLPNVIVQVRYKLEALRPLVDTHSKEMKQLYATYDILL